MSLRTYALVLFTFSLHVSSLLLSNGLAFVPVILSLFDCRAGERSKLPIVWFAMRKQVFMLRNRVLLSLFGLVVSLFLRCLKRHHSFDY